MFACTAQSMFFKIKWNAENLIFKNLEFRLFIIFFNFILELILILILQFYYTRRTQLKKSIDLCKL